MRGLLMGCVGMSVARGRFCATLMSACRRIKSRPKFATADYRVLIHEPGEDISRGREG